MSTVLYSSVRHSNFYRYYGLQLWFPEYFKKLIEDNCDLQNNTIGCTNATRLQYYQDTLYTALASLPGNIAGTVLINIIGGRIQLGMLESTHYNLCVLCDNAVPISLCHLSVCLTFANINTSCVLQCMQTYSCIYWRSITYIF